VNHDDVERVRRAICDTFAGQGYAASRQQIQARTALGQARVDETVDELAAHDTSRWTSPATW